MKSTNLFDIIYKSAKKAIALQHENGSMPPGHNGPYFDTETSIRNTSHWLVTFSKIYQITTEELFRSAATKAAKFLISSEARPNNATFYHRNVSSKDRCNGLMGQAWTIEALTEASKPLKMPQLIKVAEEVFLMHPFNSELGLWNRVEIDGKKLSIDNTFNHQLWFAAAGSLLSKYRNQEINEYVLSFLNRINDNFLLYSDGLVYHLIKKSGFKQKVKNSLRFLLKYRKSDKALKYKAVGYHSFNMYAFSIIYNVYPDHFFWNTSSFKKTLSYMLSKKYENLLEENKYGFPYNPPGFEVSFAIETFLKKENFLVEKWIGKQINKCFNFEDYMMNLNTKDPLTSSARLYEATRILNIEVKQSFQHE